MRKGQALPNTSIQIDSIKQTGLLGPLEDEAIPQFECFGEFDQQMLGEFSNFVKRVRKPGTETAIVLIDSPGGELNVLSSMIALMQSADIEWHTVAIGRAYSCGLLLLAEGHCRYAAERSTMMFHEPWTISIGDALGIAQDAARLKAHSDKITSMFAAHTKKTGAWWSKQAAKYEDKCFYFDAEVARTVGLVEYIGIPLVVTETLSVVVPPEVAKDAVSNRPKRRKGKGRKAAKGTG